MGHGSATHSHPGIHSLDIAYLAREFAAGTLTPTALIDAVYARIHHRGADPVWLHLRAQDDALAAARAVEARKEAGEDLPLYGIPFAIKDNIDVAGVPTTAACPAFSYVAERSSPVVERLVEAGAIWIGKTNLDQFATGLVGVRSPYGVPVNPFDAAYVPGGSSSGSAVAVSAGLVSFSLGTDTAGSGRVPASFNNIVGLKPTKGLLSTSGLVPACRTLDCVTVFALSVADAGAVLQVAEGYDPTDAFSRSKPATPPAPMPAKPRLAVPRKDQLEFFGDAEAAKLFDAALERLKSIGATITEIDYSAFSEAAGLLYYGPWVAERTVAVEALLDRDPDAFFPVTRKIVENGRKYSSLDTFRGIYQLEALKSRAFAQLEGFDALVVPTAGTIYTVAELMQEPVLYNSNLGHYTNFTNFFDLSGIAVPAGFRPKGGPKSGMPFGITIQGHAFDEPRLIALARAFERAGNNSMGFSLLPVPGDVEPPVPAIADGLDILVVGAHLSGQPLNPQLQALGAQFVRLCRTTPDYRLYALPGTPARPAMVRVTENGAAIEGEVWRLPAAGFGQFVAAIPSPLGIGKVQLDDGATVSGFLAEAYAVPGCRDITEFGGWREYVAAK